VAEFSVNPYRLDPYAGASFRVAWDGRHIPGVCRISGLRRTTDVVVHRNGSEPTREHRAPGLTTYEPIVLERGRTHDDSFEAWANLVAPGTGQMSLKSFRKDVRIELLNEQGTIAMAFLVHRAWPAEYVAVGRLDADADAHATESLTLQYEGFERDTSVQEPVQT
jgi:phage tail-like protein